VVARGENHFIEIKYYR